MSHLAAEREERETPTGEIPEIVREALERWPLASEHEKDQRERILLAKKFRVGDQWPEAVKSARAGNQGAIQGQPAMPPRPCLTIDRLSQPTRQISNQIKTAQFGFEVLPNGFGADSETARIYKGYLRYVQNRARGESPIEWGADGAVEGGLGWVRLRSEYVYDNPEGVPDEALEDQELRLERIVNNLTVYCDPWSLSPTRADAQFMFVTQDLSKTEFARRWPDADLAGLEDFATSGNCPNGWVENDSIRIAEYWRVTYQDIRKGARVFRVPRVAMHKITATQELEPTTKWPGSRIPLFPILGEEFNIDGKPYLRGIIEPGMDAQRMINYTFSGAIEIFALGSKSQFVAADDQIADYKAIWQTANTMNWAYLPYKPVAVMGTLLPPPQRDTSEAPIQAAAMLMQVSEDGVKATTGWYDSGLGANTQRTLSGRAKQSEIQQSELGSSNYPDNVRRAMTAIGEEMVLVAPKITRVGQLLQILGDDDKPEQVIVGQPFMQQNGKAVPVPPEQAQAEEAKKGLIKFYDFTKGRYAVTVSVGKASATKREEGAAAIGELIASKALLPAQAAVLAVEYVENLSFEGSHKAAELMRKALPPELQQNEEEGGPDPEKMAMMQQIQQLQQAIESKQVEEQAKQQAQTQRELAKAQADGQIKLQLAQADAQLTLQKAQIDAQTRIEVAKINAQAGLTEAEIKAGSVEAGHQVAREEAMIGRDTQLQVQAIDHQHEKAQAELAHDQTQATLAQQHEQKIAESEVGHQQKLEQGQQASESARQLQAEKPQPKATA